VSARSFLHLRKPALSTGLPLSLEFLCRAGLVAIVVTLAHQLTWEWLRFFTSEVILSLSALLGMATARISFDTILVQGTYFHFVVSCTFVDVFAGCIALLWNLKKSALRNLGWLLALAPTLFAFNVARLEIAQILYARGVSWTLADEVLGGCAYFAVWLVIWRLRSWGPSEVQQRVVVGIAIGGH
jgi:hypothetical protein